MSKHATMQITKFWERPNALGKLFGMLKKKTTQAAVARSTAGFSFALRMS
jgi:hypothetical protein